MAQTVDEWHTATDPISGCTVRLEPIYDPIEGARKIRLQYDNGPWEIADVDELIQKFEGKLISMPWLSMKLLWEHVQAGHKSSAS